MIDYLYYKLYVASLHSSLRDIAQFVAPVYFGGVVSANVLVLNGFLAKANILPFLFSNSKQGAGFALVMIIVAFIYFRKKHEHIIEKYSHETNRERVKGNIIVSIYVALSFLLIFAVAFFRPEKL